MFGTRISIIPSPGIVERVKKKIAISTPLAVSTPPSSGVTNTVHTALNLAAHGYHVMPYLPANEVHSRTQLATLMQQCAAAGINEVLAVGGGPGVSYGPYHSSLDLVEDIAEASGGTIKPAITGYPEAHHLCDRTHVESLVAASHLASHIVTNLCFVASTIFNFVEELRRAGVAAPVWAGVAGSAPKKELLTLAETAGVGPSLKSLSRKGPLSRRVFERDHYNPDVLMAQLKARPAAVAGALIHSFNSI